MTQPLVFIHGWSFNSTMWRPVIEKLEGAFACHTIDHGFLEGGTTDWEDVSRPAVYVCHSLGLLWLLAEWQRAKCPPQPRALIAVAAFSNFMAFTKPDNLMKTRAGIEVNARGQLIHFWRQTGAGLWLKKPLPNTPRLLEGLDWLRDRDMTEAKEQITCPITVIAAKEDNIVPKAATEAEWQTHPHARPIIWHETAPHALPLTEPDWLAEKIRQSLLNTTS